MTRKLATTASVLKWCKQLHRQGKTLTLHWDGGNDSGWVWMEIDGLRVHSHPEKEIQSAPQAEELIQKMYRELDYGSWAGEFHASGEATFDPKKEAFVGEGYYSEDCSVAVPCRLTITVPANLWFDHLELSIVTEHDCESPVVEVDLMVANGVKTDGHFQVQEVVKAQIAGDIKAQMDSILQPRDDMEPRYLAHHHRIPLAAFSMSTAKSAYEYPMETIEVSGEMSTDRNICLSLIEE